MSKRVLITGGAGFIGSHLCAHFLEKGYSVVCMDNLLTGSVDNIAHLRSPEFSFIKQDVTEHLFLAGPLDYILHFASPASPVDYLKLPIQTLKVGSLGTHKALGLAKEKGAVFLLASTSEVYGDPLVHPQPEHYWGNVNPIGPRGVYDEAKRFAEALTMAYHRAHGVDTKIVRIFNTYGPRMRMGDGRAIPTFLGQALRGTDLTVFGEGGQTRSFCFVDDLVEGIYRLLLSGENQPVNLGNPVEMTIMELTREILALTGSSSKIVHQPLPVDDPQVRQPDIQRARQLLDWEPTVSLGDGLQRTIEDFRRRLDTAYPASSGDSARRCASGTFSSTTATACTPCAASTVTVRDLRPSNAMPSTANGTRSAWSSCSPAPTCRTCTVSTRRSLLPWTFTVRSSAS
jgi:dTDP-glucose 4,6-dehydratase